MRHANFVFFFLIFAARETLVVTLYKPSRPVRDLDRLCRCVRQGGPLEPLFPEVAPEYGVESGSSREYGVERGYSDDAPISLEAIEEYQGRLFGTVMRDA